MEILWFRIVLEKREPGAGSAVDLPWRSDCPVSKFELSRNSYLRRTIQIKPSDLARFIFLRAKQSQVPWILRISSLYEHIMELSKY